MEPLARFDWLPDDYKSSALPIELERLWSGWMDLNHRSLRPRRSAFPSFATPRLRGWDLNPRLGAYEAPGSAWLNYPAGIEYRLSFLGSIGIYRLPIIRRYRYLKLPPCRVPHHRIEVVHVLVPR